MKRYNNNKLGLLAMKYRGNRPGERAKAIKEYHAEVRRLIATGRWEESPTFEDMLPSWDMPDEFYAYWGARNPNPGRLQKAIQALARDWLGRANVHAIYEEVRGSDMAILMRVVSVDQHVQYPSEINGYRVIVEEGPAFTLE